MANHNGRPILWQPNHRQAEFMSATEDEVLFGGAAGVGKSIALMFDALGLAYDALSWEKYRAIIFRKSFPELEQLYDWAAYWYPKVVPGVKANKSDHAFTFPSGAKVVFGYMERESDRFRYQGDEYQYCVARGTGIRMADGSSRPIEAVRPGDMVQTLRGPRPVTRVHRPGVKSVWLIVESGRETLVGAGHRLLTASGWVCPEDVAAIQCYASAGSPGTSEATHSAGLAPSPPCTPSAQQATARPPQDRPGIGRLASCACVSSAGTSGAASCASRRDERRPGRLSSSATPVQLVLHQAAPAGSLNVRRGGAGRALGCPGEAPGSPAGCRSSCRSGGAPPHGAQASDQACTPSPCGGGTHSRACSRAGDLGCTPTHSRLDGYAFRHPYTEEARVASEGVRLASACMAPAGEAEVFDLTVASESHYITDTDIVSSNCGWDELTLWQSDVAYDFIGLFRARSTNPKIPVLIRAATNPGNVGHAWVKKRFRVPNNGTPMSYVMERDVMGPDGRVEHVRRRVRFVPGRLEDNIYAPESYRSGYRNSLLMLPEKDRRKFLDGRWDVMEGQFFTEWNPAVHIVQPFEIPRDWPRWRAMDWGTAKPYSVGWYAMDFNGVIYRYRELYGWGGEADVGTRETAATVAERVRAAEADERRQKIQFVNNPADSAMWGQVGHEKSIADEFTSRGIGIRKSSAAEKSRISGWNEFRQRLADGTFKVFAGCEHFIRTVPDLQCDPDKDGDLLSDGEDHAADEARYSLASRRPKARQDTRQSPPPPTSGAYLDWEAEQKRKAAAGRLTGRIR